MKLSRQVLDLLAEQRKHFAEKFGREPGPNDPVFFDEDADEPTPLDPAKVEAELRDGGVDPSLLRRLFPKE